jgi:hypothetical protein
MPRRKPACSASPARKSFSLHRVLITTTAVLKELHQFLFASKEAAIGILTAIVFFVWLWRAFMHELFLR